MLSYADSIFQKMLRTHIGIFGEQYTASYTPAAGGSSTDLSVWLQREVDVQVSGYETETWEKRTIISYITRDLPYPALPGLVPGQTYDPPNPSVGDRFSILNIGVFEVVEVESANWTRISCFVLPVEA